MSDLKPCPFGCNANAGESLPPITQYDCGVHWHEPDTRAKMEKAAQGQQALELLPLLIDLCEGGDAAFHVGDCSVGNCPVEKAKALLKDGEGDE